MDLPFTSYSLLHSLIGGSRRPETWGQFDEVYRPVMIGWCQRRGLQANDAADITQDIFLKLPQKIGTFHQSKGKFRSWLKTVVQNAVTDFQRHRAAAPGQQGAGSSALHELLQNLAGDAAIDDLVTAFESRDSLAKDVCDRVRKRFEEQSWNMFLALVMEGRAAPEVAEEFGVAITSVYKTRSRIVKQLKAEYANVFGAPPSPSLSGAGDLAEFAGG